MHDIVLVIGDCTVGGRRTGHFAEGIVGVVSHRRRAARRGGRIGLLDDLIQGVVLILGLIAGLVRHGQQVARRVVRVPGLGSADASSRRCSCDGNDAEAGIMLDAGGVAIGVGDTGERTADAVGVGGHRASH